MSKSFTTILVITCAVGLSVVLNPSAERHRTTIKETIAERSQLEKILGVGEIAAFASQYHSVYLGSYTTVSDKVFSVGALGMVFVRE
jgi:hypothetical protein